MESAIEQVTGRVLLGILMQATSFNQLFNEIVEAQCGLLYVAVV